MFDGQHAHDAAVLTASVSQHWLQDADWSTAHVLHSQEPVVNSGFRLGCIRDVVVSSHLGKTIIESKPGLINPLIGLSRASHFQSHLVPMAVSWCFDILYCAIRVAERNTRFGG